MKFGPSRACLALTLALACSDAPAKPWAIAAADPATARTLTQGPVIGGLGRHDSHAWLGIPFAAPPVGALRWRAPQSALPWSGARPALAFPSGCVQYTSPVGGIEGPPGTLVGSEDCLGLNVWAPRFDPAQVPAGSARLPVLFWIHGGGNTVGLSAFFDGGHLAAEQRLIVVTTQYRLGPFGWLRHAALRAGAGDPAEASGNFGTLDLIAALRWVRANAAAFGGDPDNVTLAGESAGGLDVNALLLAPQAKGLFAHAIVESGGLSETTPTDAEAWTEQGGLPNSSSEAFARLWIAHRGAADRAAARAQLDALPAAELAASLRALPANEVLAAYPDAHGLGLVEMPLVIDDGAVLPAAPWTERFRSADRWNQVPVLLGTNRDEYKLFLFLDPRRIDKKFGFLPSFVDQPSYLGAAEAVSRAWKVSAGDAPALALFQSGLRQLYQYRFDWHDEPTVAGADLSAMLGASHGFELPFVFGHFDLGPQARQLFDPARLERAEQLSRAMRGYWAQFARTGRPGTGGGNLPRWAAYQPPPDTAPAGDLSGDSPVDAPAQLLVLDLPSAAGDSASAAATPASTLDAPLATERRGIRMEPSHETREQVLASIAADPRLADPLQRCRVYRDLTGWTHTLTRAEYATVDHALCQPFPLDRFPGEPQRH